MVTLTGALLVVGTSLPEAGAPLLGTITSLSGTVTVSGNIIVVCKEGGGTVISCSLALVLSSTRIIASWSISLN